MVRFKREARPSPSDSFSLPQPRLTATITTARALLPSSLHGALLTAWSTSAVLGPLGLGQLRQRSELASIDDLISRMDPATFAETFGATIDHKACGRFCFPPFTSPPSR